MKYTCPADHSVPCLCKEDGIFNTFWLVVAFIFSCNFEAAYCIKYIKIMACQGENLITFSQIVGNIPLAGGVLENWNAAVCDGE